VIIGPCDPAADDRGLRIESRGVDELDGLRKLFANPDVERHPERDGGTSPEIKAATASDMLLLRTSTSAESMPLARKARLRKICAVVFLVVAIGLPFRSANVLTPLSGRTQS
jgi:hypothetical protein